MKPFKKLFWLIMAWYFIYKPRRKPSRKLIRAVKEAQKQIQENILRTGKCDQLTIAGLDAGNYLLNKYQQRQSEK